MVKGDGAEIPINNSIDVQGITITDVKQDYTLTGSNYKDEKKVVIDQNGVKREALVKQRESVLSKVGIKLPVCCMMNLNT